MKEDDARMCPVCCVTVCGTCSHMFAARCEVCLGRPVRKGIDDSTHSAKLTDETCTKCKSRGYIEKLPLIRCVVMPGREGYPEAFYQLLATLRDMDPSAHGTVLVKRPNWFDCSHCLCVDEVLKTNAARVYYDSGKWRAIRDRAKEKASQKIRSEQESDAVKWIGPPQLCERPKWNDLSAKQQEIVKRVLAVISESKEQYTRNFLLMGEKGSGKSESASLVAGLCGWRCSLLSCASLANQYYGGEEAKIRMITLV